MNPETLRKRLWRKNNPTKAKRQNKKLYRQRLQERAKKALQQHAQQMRSQRNRAQFDRELARFEAEQKAMIFYYQLLQKYEMAELFLSGKFTDQAINFYEEYTND